jgi:DNA polymerase III delta prime subunit
MLSNNALFSHALLLSGGTEETRQSYALTAAKKLLCVNTDNECVEKCSACVWLEKSVHPDVLSLPRADATAIKIEDIRLSIQHLSQTPHQGKYKIVILLKADSMPAGAMNALLKTLEEPPPRSYVFLLSEYPHLLPATIRSRCQKVYLPGVKKSSGEFIAELLTTLKSLKKEITSPFESAQKWKAYPLIDVLDGLYYCLLESKSWRKGLFIWQDYLNNVRRQVLNKQNPNQLLALEHLFYRWVEII